MPSSGRDSGGELAPIDAGLFDRGVDSGVIVGVFLRRRATLAFGRNPRLAYDARLSCNAYVTKRESDLAFSPLKLVNRRVLKASRNSLKVCGVNRSPFRASVRRLTTP